jgi:hypothetical protein
LIGPSPSIRKTHNGKEIDDNNDVIIKLNNAVFHEGEEEYIGKRIDIIYTLSIAQDLQQIDIDPKYFNFSEFFYDRIQKLGVKFIVFSIGLYNITHDEWLSLHIMRLSEMYNKNNVPILWIKQSVIDNHVYRCGKIPSAGFGSILNLTQYPIKQLFIKGFTFFKDGHLNSYIGKEWKKKVEKTNEKTKLALDEEKKEKVIHSLVKNITVNISPHHFDNEYQQTIEIYKKSHNIVFDDSIKYLFEQ